MYKQIMDRLCSRQHRHVIDLVAGVNAIVGGLSSFPQLIRILVTKDVYALEPIMFWLFSITSIIWTAYGIHRRNMPIIISSALSAVASVLITVLIMAWR